MRKSENVFLVNNRLEWELFHFIKLLDKSQSYTIYYFIILTSSTLQKKGIKSNNQGSVYMIFSVMKNTRFITMRRCKLSFRICSSSNFLWIKFFALISWFKEDEFLSNSQFGFNCFFPLCWQLHIKFSSENLHFRSLLEEK